MTNKKKTAVPMTKWEGQLPRKNMSLAAAKRFLLRLNTSHSLIVAPASKSPYFSKVFQGATVSPHCLWFVETDESVPLNVNRPLLRTQERAYELCKEPQWKIRMRGIVERELLFATALSDDILPFFVRNLNLLVLPAMMENGRFVMVNHEEVLGAGLEAGSEWIKKAETIFARRSKDKTMTAQDRINFQKLLTAQNPAAKHIVLYNKSGTNVCAAYLKTSDCTRVDDLETNAFIAERVTYRIYVDTEDEAHYLTGTLNSTVVNEAIKPYQTVGVYHGQRDITRRPFEICPIPTYDPKNLVHQKIAELSRSSREVIRKRARELEGSLAKVREQCRSIVRDEILTIDALVSESFDSVPPTAEPEGRRDEQHAMFSPESS